MQWKKSKSMDSECHMNYLNYFIYIVSILKKLQKIGKNFHIDLIIN